VAFDGRIMSNANPQSHPRVARAGAALAKLALTVAVIGAVVALLAGPGYRVQWVSLGSAFLALRWATFGALGGAVAGLLTWIVLALTRAPQGRATAAAALLLGLLVAAPPVYLYDQAQRLPKIHDISTDTADPPAFVDVLPLRKDARNAVEYPPQTAAAQQRGYPDIAPLRLDVPPGLAFERAERVARAMGWQVVAARPDALRIEATDTSLVFGFKDDVVIRVRPRGQGSVVDVRSVSRIGSSDIGANARRVRSFLRKLAEA
jgi:uncharacterized protein (DUF1499 family)